MRSSVRVYGIAYRTFKELSRKSAYDGRRAYTVWRGWHASGRIYLGARPLNAYKLLDDVDCNGTNRPGDLRGICSLISKKV